MSGRMRFEARVDEGLAWIGLIGGGKLELVTITLADGLGVVDQRTGLPCGGPEVSCELAPL